MKNKKTKLMVLALLIALFMIVGVSYSFFSANISYVNKTDTKIISNTLGLNFKGKTEVLNCSNIVPGDKCIKTFDVENTSNIETYYNIYMENVENGFNSDLVYTLKEGNTTVISETVAPVTKSGKTYIKTNITIPASPGKHEYTLTLEFKYDASKDQNVNQGKEFRATIGIDTVQEASMEGDPVAFEPKCKRATTLHTETCTYTTSQQIYDQPGCQRVGVANGGTITYGNQNQTAGTLTAGDAFDCKVSSTGDYTERFYYVDDVDANTAALVYYNNVSGGVANNTATFAWSVSGNANYGPSTLISELPTTTQWDNVSLTSLTRNIKDDTGAVRVQNFPYKKWGTMDLAARLLTIDEVESACGITVGTYYEGELDGCSYLLENTRYSNETYNAGYWLEDICTLYSNAAWQITAAYRDAGNITADSSGAYGARPVIEVAKADIEY